MLVPRVTQSKFDRVFVVGGNFTAKEARRAGARNPAILICRSRLDRSSGTSLLCGRLLHRVGRETRILSDTEC